MPSTSQTCSYVVYHNLCANGFIIRADVEQCLPTHTIRVADHPRIHASQQSEKKIIKPFMVVCLQTAPANEVLRINMQSCHRTWIWLHTLRISQQIMVCLLIDNVEGP